VEKLSFSFVGILAISCLVNVCLKIINFGNRNGIGTVKIINFKFWVGVLCAAAALVATSKEAVADPLQYGMNESSTGAFYNLVSTLNATYSCTHANYGEGGTYMTTTQGANSYGGARSSYSAGCAAGHTSEAASAVVTSARTLLAATSQSLSLISARIQGVKLAARKSEGGVSMALSDNRRKGAIGISSGEEILGVGIWAQGAYTWLDDDNAATKWDGGVYSFLAGADYRVDRDFLIGLSVGYEKTDLTTEFNGGNLDADGILVAPYAYVMLDKNFNIDVTGGYQWLNYDVDRTDITGTKVTGSFDSKRLFGAFTLNADYVVEKDWYLHGQAGVSYADESQDSYTDSGSQVIAENNVALGQGIAGARVAYDLDGLVPFLSVLGEWDFSKDDVAVAANQLTPDSDDFGLRVGAGADFNLSPTFTGRLEGQSVLLRENFSEHKVLFKFRGDF